ncbi:MAG TPA: hypothetical protein VFT22_33070 [Kofleriaceae bacterium]|nr:hypothetical protein [Kofleriaceae bacterium]
MRVASWVFVLCAALGAASVFLPSVALVVGDVAGARAQLSLYKASTDRAQVRRFIAAYHVSAQRQIGARILHKLTPRTSGRPRAALEDARDAMATLDEVSDDDVRTATTLFAVALWSLLGLDVASAILVFSELMRGRHRRGRLALALAGAVIGTAIAVAFHVACREAVGEANDELGRAALVLASGAYVLPAAALGSLVAAIVLVAKRRRRGDELPPVGRLPTTSSM